MQSRRARILDVEVDILPLAEVLDLLTAAGRERKALSCSAVGMHTFTAARRDPDIRSRLQYVDLKLVDSMPAALFLRLTGVPCRRIRGQDLFNAMCFRCEQEALSVFFFGTDDVTLQLLVESLRKKYPRLIVAGTRPARYRALTAEERDADVEAIRDSGAQMVWVGLGSPRQDVWVYETKELLQVPLIGVGAAFDFEAGTRREAPLWMRRVGLEWLYRLGSEPKRLWRRYLIEAPLFLYWLIRQVLRCDQPQRIEPPTDRLNLG